MVATKTAKKDEKKSGGFTKEEELLLQDYSRTDSTKSSAVFYGNAFIVAAIPIWLFYRIHMVDLMSSIIFFVIVTGATSYLMAMAYRNTKHALKHKVAAKREEAVTREITKLLNDDKKIGRKEKDERILWKKNEVAEFESITFSIFYNNALFLAIVVILSFTILRSTSPIFNYIISVGGASGFLALLSTGKST